MSNSFVPLPQLCLKGKAARREKGRSLGVEKTLMEEGQRQSEDPQPTHDPSPATTHPKQDQQKQIGEEDQNRSLPRKSLNVIFLFFPLVGRDFPPPKESSSFASKALDLFLHFKRVFLDRYVTLASFFKAVGQLGNISKFLQGDKIEGQEVSFKGPASVIHFVTGSIRLRKDLNMIYYEISSFQPMEIYVDDEAKLTLYGLVQTPSRDKSYYNEGNFKGSSAEFSIKAFNDQKGMKLVDNAKKKMIGSNTCWQSAYQHLFAGCSEIWLLRIRGFGYFTSENDLDCCGSGYARWPQSSIPTFKILAVECLHRVQIREQILLVSVKVLWPLSMREAIVHYHLFEYFQDDLIIVLTNSTVASMRHDKEEFSKAMEDSLYVRIREEHKQVAPVLPSEDLVKSAQGWVEDISKEDENHQYANKLLSMEMNTEVVDNSKAFGEIVEEHRYHSRVASPSFRGEESLCMEKDGRVDSHSSKLQISSINKVSVEVPNEDILEGTLQYAPGTNSDIQNPR
ncbi:hypothetical protein RJT34_16721 [Clitoria ternatea]|uniref:Uncharacterized protein n=1 Tax=Clitoria ternatea TaxID=43366 RepID=A0AAN9JAR6_CLITE